MQTPINNKARFSTGWLALALILIVSACQGLAGEPEIIATLPPATVAPTLPPDIGYPLDAPNLANGAQIFAANCTRCHGPSGAGDGEFVLNGQVENIPDLTDAVRREERTPQDYFEIITNGRIESLMPPWKGTLSEAERWDVAFYAYMLAYDAEQLAQGEVIWAQECAACHGESGAGDGPEAANIPRSVGDFTNLQNIIGLSDAAIYNITAEGQGPHMPAFNETLSEEELRAVTAYVRTLATSGNMPQPEATEAAPVPSATEEAATSPEETTVTIEGVVTNETPGGTVPADLTVVLQYGTPEWLERLETPINEDGTFTFENVPVGSDIFYQAFVEYNDQFFAGNILTDLSEQDTAEIQIRIWELTEDPSVLSISSVLYQLSAAGDTLRILQIFRVNNESDRVFTTSETLPDGRKPVLTFELPPASLLLNNDSGRYIQLEDRPVVVDTRPLLPGADNFIQLSYIVPYEGSAIIEQAITYPLNGPVRLLVADDVLEISGGEQFPYLGEETIRDNVYRTYGGTLQLQPGEILRFEVSGIAEAAAEVTQSQQSSDSSGVPLLAIVLVVLGVAVIGATIVLMQRNSKSKDAQIDNLLRQIAELDEMHEAGEINHDVYRRQREAYKARLAELMQKDGEEKP